MTQPTSRVRCGRRQSIRSTNRFASVAPSPWQRLQAFLTWTAPAVAYSHGTAECRTVLGFEAGRLETIDLRLRLGDATPRILVGRLQPGSAQPDSAAQTARGLMSGLFRKTGWMMDVRLGGATGSEPLPLVEAADAEWFLAPDGRALMSVRLRPENAPMAPEGPWQGTLSCFDPEWYWQGLFDQVARRRSRGADCRWQDQAVASAMEVRAPSLSFATPPALLTDRPPATMRPATMRLACAA